MFVCFCIVSSSHIGFSLFDMHTAINVKVVNVFGFGVFILAFSFIFGAS